MRTAVSSPACGRKTSSSTRTISRSAVTHFSAERVPVSLGIALDTSGSMAGDKIEEARTRARSVAVRPARPAGRDLPLPLQQRRRCCCRGGRSDRQQLSRALAQSTPNGGTAMYDAVAEAIPLTQQGQNRKKALLVISDGNDTSSRTAIRELKAQIRESEVLVYAIGIDGQGDDHAYAAAAGRSRRRCRCRVPFPGRRPCRRPRRHGRRSRRRRPPTGRRPLRRVDPSDDRVNVVALRDMTDDSGGRTEIVRDARDLNPATASIADELSKQYYLGYPSPGKKDGRWHSIRVELRNRAYRVARAQGVRRKLECRVHRARDRARPEPSRQLRRPARRRRRWCCSPRACGRAWCRGWSATRSARCSASRCWHCCRRRSTLLAPPAVFGTLLAGILHVLHARKARAAPPLPHRRMRGPRRHRAAAVHRRRVSTTSSTARSSARR